jgi:hypothetical protein
MIKTNFFLILKGILSDVMLDGKVLNNWKACLTNNFIPNFQDKSFFSHKYTKPENLLTQLK